MQVLFIKLCQSVTQVELHVKIRIHSSLKEELQGCDERVVNAVSTLTAIFVCKHVFPNPVYDIIAHYLNGFCLLWLMSDMLLNRLISVRTAYYHISR